MPMASLYRRRSRPMGLQDMHPSPDHDDERDPITTPCRSDRRSRRTRCYRWVVRESLVACHRQRAVSSVTATPESRLARDDTFRRGPGGCWAPHSELACLPRATPKLGARARSDSCFRERSSAGGWLCCPHHWFDVPYREAGIR